MSCHLQEWNLDRVSENSVSQMSSNGSPRRSSKILRGATLL